nr:ribosome maturation factor RimM [Tissierella sp.]
MEYIVVGKIVNTHGIRGEVKIYPYTDDIERFSDLKNIYIGEDKLSVEIDNVKYHKNMILTKLKEFDNINEVLKFKEELVFIHENEKVELPKDNYFIYELIDCKVFDLEGNSLGYISDVLQNSSNDIYIIKDNGKEYLIPAVKEFIKEVNIEKKIIIIDPIEGMIE